MDKISNFLLFNFIFFSISASAFPTKPENGCRHHCRSFLSNQDKSKNQPVSPDYDFSIIGEFLFFRTVADTLKFAVSGLSEANNSTPSLALPVSESIEPKYVYSPAFRIGGTAPLYGRWKVCGIWTRLHQLSKNSVNDPNGQIFANLTVPAPGYPADEGVHASGKWHFNLDVFDLEMRYPITFNRTIKISPILGIQGFIVTQKFDVLYSVLNSYGCIDPPFQLYEQPVQKQIRSWGVGPEIGAHIIMTMPRNWAFFLTGAASCMTGRYSVKTSFPNLVGYATGTNYEINGANYRLFSMCQIKGGISKSFSRMEVEVGWEVQVWHRQQIAGGWINITQDSVSDISFWGPFAMLAIMF